jgi:hypothetical protein
MDPVVEITQSDTDLKFVVSIDPAAANAVRRTILAEIV